MGSTCVGSFGILKDRKGEKMLYIIKKLRKLRNTNLGRPGKENLQFSRTSQ